MCRIDRYLRLLMEALRKNWPRLCARPLRPTARCRCVMQWLLCRAIDSEKRSQIWVFLTGIDAMNMDVLASVLSVFSYFVLRIIRGVIMLWFEGSEDGFCAVRISIERRSSRFINWIIPLLRFNFPFIRHGKTLALECFTVYEFCRWRLRSRFFSWIKYLLFTHAFFHFCYR